MGWLKIGIYVRITEKTLKDIRNILKKRKNKYNSLVHFIRVAIFKLIKEEKKSLGVKYEGDYKV